MTERDFDGFAGADGDSFIVELDDTVLIWSSQTHTLTEITSDGERDWTRCNFR